MTRRRGIQVARRPVGLGVAAGVFVGLGLAPLVGVAVAGADGLEDVVDAALSPVRDAAAASSLAAVASTADAGDDVAQAFQADFYLPLHTSLQDWIHSSEGQQVDAAINKAAGVFLIGDGTAGTAAHPAGGAGGVLFGDGGSGWDSTEAGIAGGAGGAGGAIGNGGAGGVGGAGADGGDGGAGGQFLGNGGDGGAAGSGAGSDGLPALGGAGGNAAGLGEHGAVGNAGTLTGATSSAVVPASTAGTDGPEVLPLSTAGSWITDADGKVVILHGLNQIDNLPPYEASADGFGADDAAFLAANGFNAVRLNVEWSAVEPEPGVFNDAYLASIEQTVQMLGDHGIVTLLDMNQGSYSEVFGGQGAPAWAVQTGGLPNPSFGFPANYVLNPAENHAWDAFWANSHAPTGVGLEDSFAQMYEHVASYFKGDPDILGFGILNEPWPGTQWLSTALGSPHFDTQDLTPFYNQVASAIRAVDPTTPIFFQPNILFGNLPVNTDLGTVDASHTVLSFHPYCLTTSLIGDSSLGCLPYEQLIDGWAQDYAKAHGIPAMISEFGSTNNLTTIADERQVADQNGLSWLEFSFTQGGNPTTTGQPALVFDLDKPPVGANVDTGKLDALVESYPQLVAGTPGNWSFDSSTGTFNFSYSTGMAGGSGEFAPGSTSTIWVAPSDYPNGYQVSVTGGHVVSSANASQLVIASNAGASTVSVTVTAASGASAK
ncbi:MAG TPA: cellulase family glycosylhydrolase [Mycobacterium sp.]|nr:cellulase family glycosylhydrolase [Mycobacterium sp.]